MNTLEVYEQDKLYVKLVKDIKRSFKLFYQDMAYYSKVIIKVSIITMIAMFVGFVILNIIEVV